MPRSDRAPFGLTQPALLLVTHAARLRGRALADVVRAAVDGGVSIVQLRDKGASHDELLRQGRAVRDAIRRRALFFVNSDFQAALELGADGVHLSEDAAPTVEVRARAGERLLISRAVHSLAAALEAERGGADVLLAGTLYATSSKPGSPLLGIEGLKEICACVRTPVIAIGGVTATNANDALAAGAAGVAVIGAIFDAADPRGAAALLRAALTHRREVRSR